jgi:hypothetical protein
MFLIPDKCDPVTAWSRARVNQFTTNALCYVEWQLIYGRLFGCSASPSTNHLLHQQLFYFLRSLFLFSFFWSGVESLYCVGRVLFFFFLVGNNSEKSLRHIHYSRSFSFSSYLYNGCMHGCLYAYIYIDK